MNTKNLVRILIAGIIAASLVFVNPSKLTTTFASTTVDKGGFLFAWTGEKKVSNDSSGHGYNAVDFVRTGTNPEHFPVLAPKDGTVVMLDDSSNYGGTCESQTTYATNYIVLGHGPMLDGEYDHYSLFLHLSYGSIPDTIQRGSRVRTGQVIGIAGNTGWFLSERPTDQADRGTHLHMEVSENPPSMITGTVSPCSNYVGTLPTQPYPQRSIPNFTTKNTFGFEETHNTMPSLGTLPNSYNESGGLSGSALCDTHNYNNKVILYNHIDYGGECVIVQAPENGFNVPETKHISSIYLNPSWLREPNQYKTLTLYDQINGNGSMKVISNSEPNLLRVKSLDGSNWNDRVKYVHNASHSNASWLLEESYAFQAPFNVNIHIRVANDPDFNAWRVCFDGENCQENAAPINELYYTWNTYGWPDGDHIISIQYRRTSDNFSWANADYYETSFYLNPNRQTYAPCGTNANGARIASGSDCTIVTASVADMAPVGWADRSDLTITAQGYDVLAYDSSDFAGAPRLVRNGQTVNAGGNVSGIELRQPLPPSYVPTEPLGTDSNTLVYLPIDEGSGSTVYNQAGSMVGSIISPASFTTGLFGSAIHSVNPPDGGGISFGSQNFGSALTVEMFVKMDNTDGDQRLATQLGGGPNTGSNKWLVGTIGDRFRIWSCWISGCHEGFSLDPIQTGRWYYLMLTYDGATTAKLYVDSVLQTTLHMDGTIPGGATTFEIAKGENIYGCDCTIDDFRISNIVREPLGPPAPTPTPMPTSTPAPTSTSIATATPINGVEFLTQPWHLTGNNGAAEKYQTIATNALQGRDMIRVTYDLHGLNALGGDASALIFDQNGWQYVSLSNYGQNGLNGIQTVNIPIANFMNLNPNNPVGTLHTRFWYSGPFTVDIISVFAYSSNQSGPTPTPTSTATPSPTLTQLPTLTPTSGSTSTALSFTAVEDATIKSGSPTTNFGSLTNLEADNDPVESFLLKFNVTGINNRAIVNAKLRLYNVNASDFGGNFYRIIDNNWSQNSVTYDTRPVYDSANVLASLGSVSANNWYEVNVTSLVTGDGIYGIRVKSTSGDGADYSSREGANPPQLIITVEGSASNGLELLSSPVHLTGNNGSDEVAITIPANALNGKNMVRVTLNVHGLNALGGDASALAFSQGSGWQYVGLANYIQNGLDAVQTIEIPLSDFMALNTSQSVGDMHIRFWYSNSFTVDITSVYVYHN